MKYRTVLLVVISIFVLTVQGVVSEEMHLTGFEDGNVGETWYDAKYYNITTGGNAEIRDNVVHSGIRSFGQNASNNPEYNFTFSYMAGEEMTDFNGWFFTYENDINYTFSWKNDSTEILRFILNNTALTPVYSNGTGASIYFDSKELGDWKHFGWKKENNTLCAYFADNYLSGNTTNGSNIGGEFERINICNVTNDGGSLYFDDLQYIRTGVWEEPDYIYNSLGSYITVQYIYYYYDVCYTWNTIGANISTCYTSVSGEPDDAWTTMGSCIYVNSSYNESNVTNQWTTLGAQASIYYFLQFDDMQPANQSINYPTTGYFYTYANKGGNAVTYDFSVWTNNTMDETWVQYGDTLPSIEVNASISIPFSGFLYGDTIYWQIQAYNETLEITEESVIFHFSTKLYNDTEQNSVWTTIGAHMIVDYVYNDSQCNKTWTTIGALCIVGPEPPPPEPNMVWTTIGAHTSIGYVYADTEPDIQWSSIGIQEYIIPVYTDVECNKVWNTLSALAIVVPSTLFVDDDYDLSQPNYGIQNFSSITDALWIAHLRAGKCYIYVCNGTYIEWDMNIETDVNIIGNSSSDTHIWGGYAGNHHVFDIKHTDVNISGITISGAGGCGINIYSDEWEDQKINISDCCFVYNKDEHININRGNNISLWNNTFYNDIITDSTTAVHLVETVNSSISRNIFHGNDTMDYAIKLLNTNNITILNNYINGTDNTGIYVQGNLSSELNISNNDIYNCDNGISINEYDNITITNNTIGETLTGLEFGGGRCLNISNCYIYNWSNYGIDIAGVDTDKGYINDVYINGTTLIGGSTGIRLFVGHPNMDMNNTNISFCNIINCSQYGVYLDNNQLLHVTMGENSTIENITIYNTYFYNDSTAINQEFIGGSRELIPTKNVSIEYCTMGLSDTVGIRFDYMENAIVKNCTICEGNYGVIVDGRTISSTFYNNYIYNNTYGFYIIGSTSSNNTIYNNYFNNTHNADDISTNNYWNTTKVMGTNIIGGPWIFGNYWSDYTGDDFNGDGIGDTPYDVT